ncbi:RNA-binding transcriptional accessory protein [Spongiibacter sp. KMU-158]|uniref:RNA-binding transcriptional accessory protein n=1 Tax=Spongiibacter pelagi TaxID=2760804 RepID=A0A927GV48_9GAMM|nr:Tex family protein [Spongiibacter pelagi]MBD2857688.1 RNA-binding transcriptional accessory protein [Spongiibacter pelagi]
MSSISSRIAQELGVKDNQVNAAISLLDEGATVPFISRYRKEVTGGLDDTQMRELESRLTYLREMEERRETILNSIREQDKLTPELERDILAADTKNRLEDLYLPYKPKRRTKGMIAIEAGLEPLADALLANPDLDPNSEAEKYLNAEHSITDAKAALDGAKYILMERFSEDADLLARLRTYLWDNGTLSSMVMSGKENEGAKFRDYFEHCEPLKTTPSHRALAMFRGRNEGILGLSIKSGEEDGATSPCEIMVGKHWEIEDHGRPADSWLKEVVRWTWRIKLYTHLETDLLGQLRELADKAAIDVFARNLKDLLLAAPAGQKATIGLDPGLRTGVKVAVLDATGKVVDHCAIFPNPPQNQIAESAKILLNLIQQHDVKLIAIGNGTASRETERFVKALLKSKPELGCTSVIVNESGASIYSASEYAAREFPDLDVTIRGAISIGRRLQDPLAELVKIDPKSIGVGQYQHDVSQTMLSKSLEAVVEDCVNAVGVDVNTASPALLSRVSGLNQTLSGNIVEFRNQNGAFKSREQLLEISRFGAKTFEQAAGFLRIMGGENPLDSSAVHPESYSVVEKIVANSGRQVTQLLGDSQYLKALKPGDFADERFGVPTVTDIIRELDKPGRDPRPDFKTAEFKEGIEKVSDLEADMVLEGTVTNVTNFGAFVDIGVHQDGLVHISALSDTFVKDPHTVVKAGDIVKVKVMDVDIQRQRIALSMRMGDQASDYQAEKTAQSDRPRRSAGANRGNSSRNNHGSQKGNSGSAGGTMAALFAQAQKKNGGRL